MMSEQLTRLKEKRAGFILVFLCAALLIWLDQWTKKLALAHLKDQPEIVIWKGVFELRYLENRGAAFGMLQGRQVFFFLVAVIVLAGVGYAFYRMPFNRHYLPLWACLVLLVSGALGNMIDRISRQFLVDFLYFSLIDFPIFNVADCYVTVSAILLVFLVTWRYDEGDLAVFSWKKGESL